MWNLDYLPPLKTGDLLAFKAQGRLQQWLVGLTGALTWHWALVGRPQPDDELSQRDWSVAESISKGIARTLLSDYQDRHMRIYRPALPEGEQERMAPFIMKRCNAYGRAGYDVMGVTNAGLWFVLRHFGLKSWIRRDMKFYCIEFCNQVWADLDFPLVDMESWPVPANMENSDQLELVWGTF